MTLSKINYKKYIKVLKSIYFFDMILKYWISRYMPMWRNWQTHTTQNRAGNHVGSSPTIGTKFRIELSNDLC